MVSQINDQKVVDSIFYGFRNLTHIKRRYFTALSNDPDHRARIIPMMVGFNKPIVFDVEAQIRCSLGDGIEATSVNDIIDMVTDYNVVRNLWMLRNRYYSKLVPSFNQNISSQELLNGCHSSDYAHLVDVTETVVGSTDTLILKTKTFLTGRSVFKLTKNRKDLLGLCEPVDQLKFKNIVDTLSIDAAKAS